MDNAIHRICEDHGWSIERDWEKLSEREKERWLARDLQKQQHLQKWLEPFLEKAKNDKGVDVGAYYQLALKTL